MAEASQRKENALFTNSFSSISSDDIEKARDFHANTLGINVAKEQESLSITLPGGAAMFIYPKDNHEPATFTVLNFNVDDIDIAVDELKTRGVEFESYTGDIETDEKGIHRGADKGEGPNIAWFKDPAGNILSVIEEKRLKHAR